jgi:hydrogenase 3 maturation protease
VTLSAALSNLSKELAGAERVAVLAVGSELLGDDAAGLLVGQYLDETPLEELRVFVGATAPENCTGPIRRFLPSHLLIVDAAEVAGEPGTIELIDPKHLGGVSFATHALPLTVIVDYLKKALAECRVVVVGIKPESLAFGAPPSRRVAEAAREVAGVVRAAVVSSSRMGAAH